MLTIYGCHSGGDLNTGPQSMDFNTPMDYPRMDYGHLGLVIRVRRLSDCIKGHYTRKTGLKLDSLSFPTLITKLQQHSPLWGSPLWVVQLGIAHGLGLSVLSSTYCSNMIFLRVEHVWQLNMYMSCPFSWSYLFSLTAFH